MMSLKYIFCCSTLLAMPSFAHEPVTKFDQQVVTATKMPETNFNVAGSISTIDKQDLNRKQADRLHDLFKDMPGVEAGSGPRRTAEQINIRGFGQERTVVRVDGGRQNFDFKHNGRLFVDPEFLRQVDVLRGAHSTTHGSGALGGVVSMSTIEAEDYLDDCKDWGALGKASYGNNDCEKMGKGALYGRVTDKADGILSFVARKSNDIKPGSGERIAYSRDQIKSALGKVNFYVNEDSHLCGSFMYFKDDHPTLSSPNLDKTDNLGRFPVLSLLTPSNFPVDRDTTQTMGSVAYHAAPSACRLIDLTARYYGSTTKIEDSLRKDFSTLVQREDRTRLDTQGFDVYNISHVPLWCEQAHIDWLYGVEHYEDVQRATRNRTPRLQFPHAKLHNTGFYTRFDLHIPYLMLSPGMRYDHFKTKLKHADSSRSFTKTSPSFKVKLMPCEEMFVYGSYAEAFRAPSLTELYGTGVHFFTRRPNLFIANPALDPEAAQTFETGIGFRLSDIAMKCDDLRLKVSFFSTHADDFIEQQVNFGANTTTISNITSARLKGAEIEMVYETPIVFAGASFSAISGQNRKTKDRLSSIPPHKAATLLGSKITEYDLEFGWRAVMNKRHKQTLNLLTSTTLNVPTPGYSTHDLFLTWAPICGWFRDIEFGLRVDNVTNKNYRKYLSALPEQGRNIKVSLSSKI